MSRRRAAKVRPAESVLGDLLDELELLFADLDGLADQLIAAAQRAGDRLDREALAALRPVIFDLLTRRKGLVAGAGLIMTPGRLRDAPHWLEWWWTTQAGALETLRINLDPTAPDFFDYSTADWYATPARTRQRRVSGPYVDYVCTNAYSVTLATPAQPDGDLIGVAAADVLLASLEERVLPVLTSLSRPVVLANGDGRVIASNSPHWAPGLSIAVEPPSPAGHPDSPLRSWVLVDV
jgi:hypothetical protein